MFETISVPSGIGDLSWMYSKLKFAPPVKWLVSDGWPPRSVPFLKMLSGVGDADYGHFSFHDIVTFEQATKIGHSPRWANLKEYTGTNLLLEANTHLELGRPLKDWLPDLPTDYHYDVVIPEVDARRAAKFLTGLPRPVWGFSAASYRGAEAWKTWGVEPWIEFLNAWLDFAGGSVIAIGANWDDLTVTVAEEGGFVDSSGRTSVPGCLHLMKEIDGYIGFSSGLGILRTVFDKPTMMMWPAHQFALSRSWADPEMLETRKYVAAQWVDPKDVLRTAKAWHKANYQ